MDKFSALKAAACIAAKNFERWSKLAALTSESSSVLHSTTLLETSQLLSALLAELEAAMKQNQELARQCGRLGARAAIAERKLATPLQLTDERTLWAGEDDYDTGHVKGWNANRIEQAALLKKQGFTVGDE